MFGEGSVLLSQCTAEVAHFSLQWWTEPSTLSHRSNLEGELIKYVPVLFEPVCMATRTELFPPLLSVLSLLKALLPAFVSDVYRR